MRAAPTLDEFLARWTKSEGSERSHAQHFLLDLGDLIGLDRPGTKPNDDFWFEKDADVEGPDRVHYGRADLVRRGAFVIETKQFGDIATTLETFAALGQFVTLAPGYFARPVRRAA